MSCGRRNSNIWWYLFTFWSACGGKRWRGYEVFTKQWWRSPYIWHDSVGKFWNRWVVCPLVGHKNVKDVSDPGEPKELYCFDCGTYLK
jgi:hypothetical protein